MCPPPPVRYAAGRPWLVPLAEADVLRMHALEDELPLEMIRSRRAHVWAELINDQQETLNRQRDTLETESWLTEGGGAVSRLVDTPSAPAVHPLNYSGDPGVSDVSYRGGCAQCDAGWRPQPAAPAARVLGALGREEQGRQIDRLKSEAPVAGAHRAG